MRMHHPRATDVVTRPFCRAALGTTCEEHVVTALIIPSEHLVLEASTGFNGLNHRFPQKFCDAGYLVMTKVGSALSRLQALAY